MNTSSSTPPDGAAGNSGARDDSTSPHNAAVSTFMGRPVAWWADVLHGLQSYLPPAEFRDSKMPVSRVWNDGYASGYADGVSGAARLERELKQTREDLHAARRDLAEGGRELYRTRVKLDDAVRDRDAALKVRDAFVKALDGTRAERDDLEQKLAALQGAPPGAVAAAERRGYLKGLERAADLHTAASIGFHQGVIDERHRVRAGGSVPG